eukprot:gnl/Spiro4/9953_TR5283_c0_g1_i1.p1 gnl/Spiro4/9953_TR5283_c0_g1~~gnl/Spiro4/9953_TR5283_c0_g1_i1.p1  ORF type:complete len:183 (-),score=27.51 gnl/Spiro4/9953_TR5283_c0_g1_i1:49-597(-)
MMSLRTFFTLSMSLRTLCFFCVLYQFCFSLKAPVKEQIPCCCVCEKTTQSSDDEPEQAPPEVSMYLNVMVISKEHCKTGSCGLACHLTSRGQASRCSKVFPAVFCRDQFKNGDAPVNDGGSLYDIFPVEHRPPLQEEKPRPSVQYLQDFVKLSQDLGLANYYAGSTLLSHYDSDTGTTTSFS